ncbi:MAG: sugar phosphate isomerase/epimerase family protein, partial [Gaiellaceae bacterium]
MLGIHALVWVDAWSEEEARRAIRRTREAGYDLLEIPLLDPYVVDAAMTRRLLEQAGIAASCSLGLPFDADVSSADPAVAARGEAFLERAIQVTAALGASFLGGVVHSAMGKHLEPPTELGRSRCVEALRRLAERAERRGVTIGVEAVNRYESNLVNTADQALALVDQIGASNLVVHLDTYHMNIEEADLAGPLHRCGGRLGYVHVGESNRGYLGRGTVDFGTFFHALADIGYA